MDPAVKQCHLVFHTSRIKSVHAAHLLKKYHPTVVCCIPSSLKGAEGFCEGKTAKYREQKRLLALRDFFFSVQQR